MKTIYNNIISAVSSKDFYKSLKEKSVSDAIKAYSKFVLVLSVIVSFVLGLITVPLIYAGVAAVSSYIEKDLPSEFSLKIESGLATTSLETPYELKLPSGLKSDRDNGNSKEDLENVLVIDFNNQITPSLFHEYKTIALITKDSYWVYDKNDSIEVGELKEFPDMTINKVVAKSKFDMVRPYIPLISILLFVLFVFSFFIYYLISLLGLVLPVAVIYLTKKLRKVDMTLKEIVVASIFAVMPVMLLSALLIIAGIKLPYLIKAILVIFLVSYNLDLYDNTKKDGEVVTEQNPNESELK